MFQSSLLGPPMRICLRDTVGLINFSVSSLNIAIISGDVICFQVLGQTVVVLCSLSAIKDLLEKRGEVYSDRTRFPIFEMCVHLDTYPWVLTTQVSQNGSQLDLARC
jgi:hypothetical protein